MPLLVVTDGHWDITLVPQEVTAIFDGQEVLRYFIIYMKY
jgi:hypothetical protein